MEFNVDQRGSMSLYEYIYQQIKIDILSGSIAPDEHLPSKRALSDKLGVSLITVEKAYDQLIAEGFVYARPRRGYYASVLPEHPRQVEVSGASAAQGHDGSRFASSSAEDFDRDLSSAPISKTDGNFVRFDLSSSSSIAGEAGARLWSRALRSALASEPEGELYGVSPAQGSLRLRRAIARHLSSSRGMDADPECIVIGAGAQLLDVQLAQLFGTTRTFAVEDPGYLRLTRIYQALGARVRHIAMDGQGANVDELTTKRVDVFHLMPSHQFPTGRVTSIARRYELLGWAASSSDRYLIEDDYDCEFRLAGRPVPPLASIDASERVVYSNTFSRSLSSALRLAYMVLPSTVMERYQRALSFYSSTVSTVDQVVLARLLESGSYERHINRIRKRQRDARNELVGALRTSTLGERIFIEEADSGMHFVLAVDDPRPEKRLADLALGYGVRLSPLSSFAWCDEHARQQDGFRRFVVQYGAVAQNNLAPAAQALARAWKV